MADGARTHDNWNHNPKQAPNNFMNGLKDFLRWYREQLKWAEQGGTRFTFHDIRAKALTDAKRMGLDAQSLAGHSSAAMTEHYIKQREFKIVKGLK
ncbi:MAG: hypothetical protein U1E13_03070 [Methylophilaceae bacterium]|nr:hypothetical protein [Methylophilaceae bacterium]